MLPKTLDDYGGARVDARPVSNPQSQYAADNFNRAHEDAAQMTRTAIRAVVQFLAVDTGNPLPVNTIHRSVWGTGATQKPVVTRTGAGLYLVSYGSSFDDGLGLEDSLETVSFAFPPLLSVLSGDSGDDVHARPVAYTANTFSLVVESPKGTAADQGNVSGNFLTVCAAIV